MRGVAWRPEMITEPKKRQLKMLCSAGAFIRLKDNTKFPRVWLSENGTYFPYENGWFIEGWGEFYSHDQYEQNPNVIVVGTMQVPSPWWIESRGVELHRPV